MQRQALAILVTLSLAAGCKGSSFGGKANLKTDDDKIIYSVGLVEGGRIAPFDFTAEEMKIFMAGLMDAKDGKKPQVDLNTYGPRIHKLLRDRQEKRTKVEKEKSKQFLDKVAGESGVEKLPSGVMIQVLKPGTGASPEPADSVKVNYRGTLANGEEFDSSKEPTTFNLRSNIRCWTEALPKMKVGQKAKIVCPPDTAYGDHGRPPKIPGGAALVFEVELLDVQKPTTPPSEPGAPGAPGTTPPGHPPIPGTGMPSGHPPIPGAGMPSGHPPVQPAAPAKPAK